MDGRCLMMEGGGIEMIAIGDGRGLIDVEEGSASSLGMWHGGFR